MYGLFIMLSNEIKGGKLYSRLTTRGKHCGWNREKTQLQRPHAVVGVYINIYLSIIIDIVVSMCSCGRVELVTKT